MNIITTCLLGASFTLALASANAQEDCCGSTRHDRSAFRDAATHESLAEKRKGYESPLANLKAPEPLTPDQRKEMLAERSEAASLVERSEIIHFRDLVTLVPKRAVLHLPDHLKGVRGKVHGKRLVNWTEFYRANHAWIDTVEVSRAQAEGREPLPEKLTESLEKRTKAVVAVMSGGPISVLPVQVPEETKDETVAGK